MEEQLSLRTGRERALLGRDAYTFWHFPLVSGIIALAVEFEAAFHPSDYSPGQMAAAVGLGLALFLVATAGALWRAVGGVLWNRLLVLTVTLVVLAMRASATPIEILGIGCVSLVTVIAIEQLTVRRRLAGF